MPVKQMPCLVDIMTITGMWPREWRSRWVTIMYNFYSRGLDTLMICYLLCKLMFTFQVRDCDKFMQNVFESLFLFIVTFERFAIKITKHKINDLLETLDELKSSKFYSGEIVERYDKYNKWIRIWFASSIFFGVVQIFLKYKSPEPKCEAMDSDKFDWQNRLYIELWLPYDETLPCCYTITDSVVTALMLITSVTIYVFSVIIPLFVLEICCHLKILASVLGTNLITNKKCYRLDQDSLEDAIKYHQQILEFCKKLNYCFHIMVGLKIVFLSLPIIVGVFAVITKKIVGRAQMEIMGHFMIQMFFELFVFCWFGEQLSHHSLLVHTAMYESKWYEMDYVDQRSVLVIICRAQRPARLEIFPYFKPANLQTFIGISHFSYSLYSVLAGISR